MRLLTVLFLLGLALTACGEPTALPTPLPTAVPPDSIESGGSWAVGYTYEFPPGTFGLGQHRYNYLIYCPLLGQDQTAGEWRFFEISEDVVKQPEPLYLRLHGLSAEPYAPSAITNTLIHPDRPIIAVVHLVGFSRENAEMAADSCEVVVLWDDMQRHALTAGEPFEP